MTTYQSLGADKSDSGTAIHAFDGFDNRRTWDAIAFCIHPKHDSDRCRVNLDRGFIVIVTRSAS